MQCTPHLNLLPDTRWYETDRHTYISEHQSGRQPYGLLHLNMLCGWLLHCTICYLIILTHEHELYQQHEDVNKVTYALLKRIVRSRRINLIAFHFTLVYMVFPSTDAWISAQAVDDIKRSTLGLIHPMRARLPWRYAAGPIGVIRTNDCVTTVLLTVNILKQDLVCSAHNNAFVWLSLNYKSFANILLMYWIKKVFSFSLFWNDKNVAIFLTVHDLLSVVNNVWRSDRFAVVKLLFLRKWPFSILICYYLCLCLVGTSGLGFSRKGEKMRGQKWVYYTTWQLNKIRLY